MVSEGTEPMSANEVPSSTHIVTTAVANSSDLVTGGTAWMMEAKSAMAEEEGRENGRGQTASMRAEVTCSIRKAACPIYSDVPYPIIGYPPLLDTFEKPSLCMQFRCCEAD